MPERPLHAVLTGDVIGSTRLGPDARARLPDALYDAFESVHAVHSLRSALAFDVFRGDAWQLYVEHPAAALQVAVTFRAWLRADAEVDSRVALVVDAVDFVDVENVSESDGPAFRRSGYALDGLGRRTMACLLPEGWTPSTRQLLFNTIASATGAFVERWTSAQAQAVALTLSLPPTSGRYAGQEQVAAAWTPEPVSQPTVSEHLRKAHWDVIEEYLDSFADEVERLVEDDANGPASDE